jgi:hypothetical protein
MGFQASVLSLSRRVKTYQFSAASPVRPVNNRLTTNIGPGISSSQGPAWQAAKKSPSSLRLLKKVQMQGGVTHPSDGYPGPSEVY